MSLHYFTTKYRGFDVTITIGWAQYSPYFFMSIPKPYELQEELEPSHEELCYGCLECAGMLYSKIYETTDVTVALDHYRAALRTLSLTVPESMFIEVERDASLNRGKRSATHTADGRVFEHIS